MDKIHIIPSEFTQELELQLAYAIMAGFPSPAEDIKKVERRMAKEEKKIAEGSKRLPKKKE